MPVVSGAQSANPYDDLIADQQRQGLRASLNEASTENPDTYAKAKALSERVGIPVRVVAPVLPEVEQRAKVTGYDALFETAPGTARFLSNPENAKLAHDDIENMSLFEKLSNSWRRGVLGFKQSFPAIGIRSNAVSIGNLDLVEQQLKLGARPESIPDAQDLFGARWMSQTQRDALRAQLSDSASHAAGRVAGLEAQRLAIPQDPVIARAMQAEDFSTFWQAFKQKPFEFIATVGLESLPTSLPGMVAAIPAGIAAGPAGVAAAMGTSSFGFDYSSSVLDAMRGEGIDTTNREAIAAAVKDTALMNRVGQRAFAHAAVTGAFDAASGGLAGRSLAPARLAGTKAGTAANLALQAPVQGALGAAGEAGGTVAAGEKINVGSVMAEFFGEFATAPIEVASASGAAVRQRFAAAEQAKRGAQFITDLSKASTELKLRERDPQTFTAFVAEATKGGPLEAVYVDASVFAQGAQEAGIDVSRLMPQTAAALADAIVSGSDVRIPVSEFAAAIPGTTLEQSIVQELRTAPDAPTAREAGDAAWVKETERITEKILSENDKSETWRQSAKVVEDQILNDLTAAKRFTPAVNKAYAGFMSAFYSTQAHRLGITPDEMFKRYPVRVQATGVLGPRVMDQPAYHGSPHDFDKFSMEKIGTGEGAQAYGWGLYFAENPKVAGEYQKNLSANSRSVTFNGDPVFVMSRSGGRLTINDVAVSTDIYDAVSEAAIALEEGATEQEANLILRKLKVPSNFGVTNVGVGALYQVDIPDAAVARMLDWDNVIPESQRKTISAAMMEKFGTGASITTGEMIYRNLSAEFRRANDLKIREADSAASKFLNSLGIPGIKYFDGSSRTKGDGTRNLVVFDDSIITITHKNGQPLTTAERAEYFQSSADSARAQIAFQPDGAVISLFKNADLSSFLHESGHLYLEILTDLANQPDAPAAIVGDMQSLLKWFGIENADQWNALTLEEKRPYHEQFARGMEAYLFEGKSPNIEMQSLFQRFRAWMLNVYRQLRALNVELTDEVRGVMDRMLATNDQILAAEQARNMEPLFATKPDGMSDAEWLDYQALGAAPTQEAVEALQARSLRDMKWLSNAKSKVIRDLQRQANDQRRAVRIEARREILSQPIYQAWQFLTGEVEKSDKPVRKPSADLDPAVDSLLVAIAKSGGLDTAEAVRRWGIDPSEVKGLERGGKKAILRKKGGKDIDTMLEELAQYGYFDLDMDGKADERQFEDKFRAERGGDLQYSNAADYDTINADRYGLQDEAAKLTDEPAGKLDTRVLKERYGEAPDAPWRRLVNLGMTSETGGIHPDIIAEAINMRSETQELTSGDDMVRRLIDLPAPRDAINTLTDQRMLEQYGDMVDPVAIQRAAEAAIHNEARARLVATELRMAEKATSATADTGRVDSRGRPIRQSILTTAAREFAARIISGKQIKDIRPAAYSAAAARAGAAAQRALGGDLAEVAAQKRNQLVNTYAAKAATDAIDEIQRDVDYFKRVENSKTIDPEYRAQIHGLLERYDLRQVTNREAERRQSLADWIKKQEDLGLQPVIDETLLADLERKPYREMTLEELRGLYDAVRNIEHLGRLKHRLLTAKDAREFAEVVAAIRQAIVDNAKQTLPERRESDRGVLVSMGRVFRSAKAIHRKFSSLVRQFDGYKDGGDAWENLVRTMNERGAFEADETLKATKALSEILGPLVTGGKKFSERRRFDTIGKSFSREEIIGIALNMGNQTNVERVLTGENLTPEQLDTLLRTLSKADWDGIQKTWDYLDSFWPQIAAKEKRVTGVEPQRVERAQVVTQYGVYPGGYYPIAYDRLRSERSSADVNAEVQRQVQNGLYARAQTARGHTKARTESTGRPLRYDFGEVLTRHVTQVIHDLAWHEYLIDANRILASNSIETAIKEHYGVEVLTELKDMMRDIAVGDLGTEKGAAFFNHLRHGTTIAALGFNVFNALQNITGITQSVSRIGTEWVFKGAAHWLGDAANFESGVKKMHDKSPQMRMRAQTINREINDIRNKISGKDSKITAAYFWLTIKTQLIVDTPTWWGAYEKAMAQPDMTDEQAIARADQAVLDAQGGGQIKDLAGIQRGSSGLKLFTTFYSYFNTTLNNMVEAYGRTNFRKPKDVALFTADMALLWTIPALMSTLLMAAFKGDWDDEDKLTKKILGDQISYLMGTVVGLREAASGVQAATGTGEGFGYTGPASVRFFSDVYKLGQQTNQVFSNGSDALDEAFWKSLNSVLGTVFHYPAGQINRTVDGIVTMAEGKTSNPGALLVGSNQK